MPGVSLRWTAVVSARVVGQATAVTDHLGIYLVTVQPADFYSVEADGHALGTVLPGSRQQSIDFLQNTGGCPTYYGAVLDGVTRSPVTDAVVRWVGETRTDASGQYRLSVPCRPGTFGYGTTMFSVEHQQYATFSTPSARREHLGTPGELRRDVLLTPGP